MTKTLKEETIQLLNIQLDLLLSNSEYFLNHADDHQIDDLQSYFTASDWNSQNADHQRKAITVAFYLVQELAFVVDNTNLALDEQYLVINRTHSVHNLLNEV
jgi:hypothetical protein